MAFTASSKDESSTARNSATVTTPGSPGAGAVIHLIACHDSSDGVFSWPGGFTSEQENDPSGAVRYGHAWLLLTGAAAANYTVTYSGTANQFQLIIEVFTPEGGYSVNAIRSSIIGEDSADGIIATTAVTGATKGDLSCAFASDDNQTSITAGPSGMTQRQWSDGTSVELVDYTQDDPGTGSLSKQIQFVSNSQFGAMALFIEYAAAASGQPPRTDHQHRLRRAA